MTTAHKCNHQAELIDEIKDDVNKDTFNKILKTLKLEHEITIQYVKKNIM